MFSEEGLTNLAYGIGGGALIGGLTGAGVYLVSPALAAAAPKLLLTGVRQLLIKMGGTHSKTAAAAVGGFGVGLISGLFHPEIEQRTGISPGLLGGVSSGLTILAAELDFLFRGAAWNMDILRTVFGAEAAVGVRLFTVNYLQSTTFMSLGAVAGFTAGYTVGYHTRDWVIDPLFLEKE